MGTLNNNHAVQTVYMHMCKCYYHYYYAVIQYVNQHSSILPAFFFPTDGAEEASSKNGRCRRLEMIQPESSEPLLKEVLTEVSC